MPLQLWWVERLPIGSAPLQTTWCCRQMRPLRLSACHKSWFSPAGVSYQSVLYMGPRSRSHPHHHPYPHPHHSHHPHPSPHTHPNPHLHPHPHPHPDPHPHPHHSNHPHPHPYPRPHRHPHRHPHHSHPYLRPRSCPLLVLILILSSSWPSPRVAPLVGYICQPLTSFRPPHHSSFSVNVALLIKYAC